MKPKASFPSGSGNSYRNKRVTYHMLQLAPPPPKEGVFITTLRRKDATMYKITNIGLKCPM